MSARRVAVLTAALPQHSRTSLALSGERAAWNPDRVLLGTVVERLDLLTATLVKVNGGRARQPKPIVPRRELAPRREARPTSDVLANLDRMMEARDG